MKKFYFVKLSGSGNDFILFDKRLNTDLKLTTEFIKQICSRGTSIGADGVLLFNDHTEFDYSIEYFNADGSTGSLCGNGARCSIKYAHNSSRLREKYAVRFLFNAKEYSGAVINENNFRLDLPAPLKRKLDFRIKAANQLIKASFIDNGAPHVVIKSNDILAVPNKLNSYYKDLNKVPVYEIGKEIRYSTDFLPEGTNVNFIKLGGNKIFIRTYERGVENETLACGTGAVAAGITAHFSDELKPAIDIITKRGEKLIVDFKMDNDLVNDLSLTGEAKIIYKGEITD